MDKEKEVAKVDDLLVCLFTCVLVYLCTLSRRCEGSNLWQEVILCERLDQDKE